MNGFTQSSYPAFPCMVKTLRWGLQDSSSINFLFINIPAAGTDPMGSQRARRQDGFCDRQGCKTMGTDIGIG